MPAKPPVIRLIVRKAVLALAVVLAVVSVKADGPSDTVTGVTLTSDSGNANGQSAGRAGGRTFVYTVGNTSQYATLFWGLTTSPSAAFDNNVGNPGEVMTFDATSNLNGGVARWTGSAVLPLSGGGSIGVPTRFTLSVTTTGGAPVQITTNAGGAAAGINVKPLTTYTANVLFEAQVQPGLVGSPGTWVPILDFYDVQPTPIGNPPSQSGPVLTSYARGFYFTSAVPTGMSVDQHDLNEIARFNTLSTTVGQIKGDTGFLRTDVPGRLGSIANDLGSVKSTVQTLLQNQGQVQIPSDIARRSDVQSAKNDVQEMLMILFGLMPCPPEAQEVCDNATLINKLATQVSVNEIKTAIAALPTQASLDQVKLLFSGLATNANVDQIRLLLTDSASQTTLLQVQQQLGDVRAAVTALQGSLRLPSRLEMQVVELTESDTAHTRRWLVRTGVNGAPASAELSGLIAIGTDKKKPATVTDVTAMAAVTQLMPGVMHVSLDVSKPNLGDLAFQFSVRRVDGTDVMQAATVVGDTKK